MAPTLRMNQAPAPPPPHHRATATALHLDALPAGPSGTPRVYAEDSLTLLALLRTLWRLSYQEVHDWLYA